MGGKYYQSTNYSSAGTNTNDISPDWLSLWYYNLLLFTETSSSWLSLPLSLSSYTHLPLHSAIFPFSSYTPLSPVLIKSYMHSSKTNISCCEFNAQGQFPSKWEHYLRQAVPWCKPVPLPASFVSGRQTEGWKLSLRFVVAAWLLCQTPCFIIWSEAW